MDKEKFNWCYITTWLHLVTFEIIKENYFKKSLPLSVVTYSWRGLVRFCGIVNSKRSLSIKGKMFRT